MTTDAAMPAASSSRARKRSLPKDNNDESREKKRVHQSPSSRLSQEVEEIDLVNEEGSAEALLDKERADLVKTQQSKDGSDKSKTFGQMNCIICLDNFTNLTATACGT